MGMPLLAASSFVPDGIPLGEPTYVGRPGSASSCQTTVAHLPQPKTRAGLPLRVCKSTAPSFVLVPQRGHGGGLFRLCLSLILRPWRAGGRQDQRPPRRSKLFPAFPVALRAAAIPHYIMQEMCDRAVTARCIMCDKPTRPTSSTSMRRVYVLWIRLSSQEMTVISGPCLAIWRARELISCAKLYSRQCPSFASLQSRRRPRQAAGARPPRP
jgi:hypothetical protein